MALVLEWKKPLHSIRRMSARLWLRMHSNLKIIGVSGSYGKTNTVQAISAVLAEKAPVLTTDLNLDTIYNLPITLLKLRNFHRFLVLEYGVDHRGEMNFHLTLVKPSIVVLTGINPTHSEPGLLDSLEGIINEKSKLIETLSKKDWLILNWDDLYVRQMSGKTSAQNYRYGTSKEADFWADGIRVSFEGTEFNCHFKKEKIKIKTGLIGRHFVQNCLAAIAVGRVCGLSWLEIKTGLAKLKPLKGRLSIEKGPLGTILINDALRANPASTVAGLQTLADLPLAVGRKRLAVLGEMGELGSWLERGHRLVGKKVAEIKPDFLVAIGPSTQFIVDEAIKAGMKKTRIFWVENVNKAAVVLKKILKKGDLFYLKGSLLRHLERVLLILKGRKVNCRLTACHRYESCNSCPNSLRSY